MGVVVHVFRDGFRWGNLRGSDYIIQFRRGFDDEQYSALLATVERYREAHANAASAAARGDIASYIQNQTATHQVRADADRLDIPGASYLFDRVDEGKG